MICPKCKRSPLELVLHKVKCTDWICDYEDEEQPHQYNEHREEEVWTTKQNGGKKIKKSTILG